MAVSPLFFGVESMDKEVRVRIGPSPTGDPHVGTAISRSSILFSLSSETVRLFYVLKILTARAPNLNGKP